MLNLHLPRPFKTMGSRFSKGSPGERLTPDPSGRDLKLQVVGLEQVHRFMIGDVGVGKL